jgi:predicted PilT family ATPase
MANLILRFHEKLQRFFRKENSSSGEKIPVRVSSAGATVTLRGPASAVDELEAKAKAFVEQEKEDEKERGFTTSFEFPQKFANHLIGKGGSNIKDLRDRFDVEIQVQDGMVELKGPKAKAEAAKGHILSLSKSWADETTHVLKIDPRYHKNLIGSGGNLINRLQTKYKVLIFFPRVGRNSRDDQSNADAASEVGKQRRQQEPDEVIIRGPKKGADAARDEIVELRDYLKDNSFSATVSVQQKQLPSLIGQGGAALDGLRQMTQAKIEIQGPRDANLQESDLVEIQVTGTKEQVAAAKKLLEEKRVAFDDTVIKTIEVDRKHHKALIGTSGTYLPSSEQRLENNLA